MTSCASWAMHLTQLLRRTEQYQAPEPASDSAIEDQTAEHGGKTSEMSPTNCALVEGSGKGWMGERESKLGAGACACVCVHHIVLPTYFGQSVCQSQTGGGDTVAAQPKYSSVRRGTKVYRAISNSPKVFQNFLSFLFSLVAEDPRKFQNRIQRLYHPI